MGKYKVNSNFYVELMDDSQFFLVDQKNGKGYYTNSNFIKNNLTHIENNETMIDPPWELIKLGLFVDEFANVDDYSPSKINKFITPMRLSNARKVLGIFFALSLLLITGLFINFRRVFALFDYKGLSSLSVILGFVFYILGIIFIHEFSHIVTARAFNLDVIKIGWKLRYGVIPIFYVKFMPTSNNWVRSTVAYSGILSDLILLFAYQILFLKFDNYVFAEMYFFQFITLIYGFNIFFPTDFTVTIFSILGAPNFRSRSLNFFKTKLFFWRKAKVNKIVENKSKIQKLVYFLYGFAFYFLIFLFFIGLIIYIRNLFLMVGENM